MSDPDVNAGAARTDGLIEDKVRRWLPDPAAVNEAAKETRLRKSTLVRPALPMPGRRPMFGR